MNPKSGKAGKAESPRKPEEAEEADLAEPGALAKQQTRTTAQSESTPGGARPSSTDQTNVATEKVWISIELQDEEGNPVANTPYEVKVPNEDVAKKGKLDGNGKAIIEGISPGNCLVCFPRIHGKEWKKISEQNEKGGI